MLAADPGAPGAARAHPWLSFCLQPTQHCLHAPVNGEVLYTATWWAGTSLCFYFLLPTGHSCLLPTCCPWAQVIPAVLGEFTMRATNPLRALLHRLLPFLPAAHEYLGNVKVRELFL